MPSKVMDEPNEKQKIFLKADNRFIAYGGSRGGGKSWAVRQKAKLLSLNYAGIRILLLRKTFPELKENHILPLIADLQGMATYKDSEKVFTFPNKSRLKLGYCDTDVDVNQYQGQEYDVIFMDEATHFTEYQFNTLTACLRGVNEYPKRFYITCNPGGVGHGWVKRLFIDREYKDTEKPGDYLFVAARVYDNKALMEKDRDYVKMLENLPDGLRKAWLDGDWDIFEGQYFPEFRRDIHVVEPFDIPSHWKWYFTMDYGGDMAAFYWIAVDEQLNAYVVKEFCQGRDNDKEPLIASEAASVIKAWSNYPISTYLAPHDMWNTDVKSGKCIADIFAEHGIYLTKTNKDRVAGWLAVKEYLKPFKDVDGMAKAKLRIFSNCTQLIKHLPALQYDPKKPSDVAIQPHDITHSPDALRGFCVYWTGGASAPKAKKGRYTADMIEDYENGNEAIQQIMRERYGEPY